MASAAIRSSPDERSAAPLHAVLGEIARREGNWEEGVRHFEAAAAHLPVTWVYASLAECCWRTARLARALECYRRWAEEAPANGGPRLGMANVLRALGRFAEARQHLEKAGELNPADARVHAARGCLHASLDEFDDAERELSAAAALDGSLAFCRLIGFGRPFFEKLAGLPEVPAPPVIAEAGAAPGFSAVVLTSCDPLYLRKYGPYFLASYAQNAPRRSLLHLHLYDPRPELLVEVKDLFARAGIGRYVVSGGHVEVNDGTDYTRRVIYSCGRFLYLPAWMEQYRAPVLALDIDAVLENGARQLVEFAAGHDAGLTSREPPDSPWLDILAGVLVANPTPAGLSYFRLVRNYISHYLRAGEAHWHMDQIALYCSLRMLRRFADPPGIAWFSGEALHAGIWHLGHAYDYKLADERLARYRLGGRLKPDERSGSFPQEIWRWLIKR